MSRPSQSQPVLPVHRFTTTVLLGVCVFHFQACSDWFALPILPSSPDIVRRLSNGLDERARRFEAVPAQKQLLAGLAGHQ